MGLREFLHANRRTAIVASGLAVAAGVNYTYHIATGRILGPADYGAFAALVGLFTIVAGLCIILQNLVATQVTVHGPAPNILAAGHRLGIAAGLGLVLILLLASPFLIQLLRLPGILPILALALAALVTFAQSVELGGLQGSIRSRDLAANYVWTAGGRFLLGVGLLLAGFGLTAAVLGLAAGAAAGALAARLAGPRQGGAQFHGWVVSPSAYALGYATLLAFTNVDLLVARWALPAEEAGQYAFAAAIGRIVLFLAAPIVVANFPALAQGDTVARRHARWLVVALGGGLAVALLALRGALTTTLMGPAFSGAAPLLAAYALAVVPFALLNVELARAAATRPVATASALLLVLSAQGAAFLLWHDTAWHLLGVLAASGVVATAAIAAVQRRAGGGGVPPVVPSPVPESR